MHIDDLILMVSEDVGKDLRRDEVEAESSRTPRLHQKYRILLLHEKNELERMKLALLPLLRKRRSYYKNLPIAKASDITVEGETLDLKPVGKIDIGTDPASKDKKRVVMEVLDFYMHADPDVVAARDLINQQAQKVDYLVDVLRDNICSRSFHLSNILNSQRFKAGMARQDGKFDLANDSDLDD